MLFSIIKDKKLALIIVLVVTSLALLVYNYRQETFYKNRFNQLLLSSNTMEKEEENENENENENEEENEEESEGEESKQENEIKVDSKKRLDNMLREREVR